jgi:hypothetical protein
MVTNASMQYNEASAQTERVPLRCKLTGKMMTRVSLTGDWPADLRQWVWCRGCHREHEVTREHIEEARCQS